MDNKTTTVSKGTNIISSVGQNTFTFSKAEKVFSFTPNKESVLTPTPNKRITLQNRREYHYYVED